MADASYYEWCLDTDVVTKVRHLLTDGGYYLRDSDGKIDCRRRLSWNTPWHHVQQSWYLDCNLWHHIMFDVISMALPGDRRFVPAKCQNCYKVVVRPKNLKQLFALLELEKELGQASKCGIELRDTVHGLYGGYFYNWGLEEGLQRYEQVRDAVDKNKHLGPDIGVLLKRACTEYELACGPSDKWEITDEQLALESLINRTFVRDTTDRKQPDWCIAHIHRKWIEFAYAHGDPTYAEFTNGQPLSPPYVTYHDKDGAE